MERTREWRSVIQFLWSVALNTSEICGSKTIMAITEPEENLLMREWKDLKDRGISLTMRVLADNQL
jgi:hypothetical protein